MQHHASDTPPPSELVNYILACDTRSRVEVAKLFKQLLWAHGSVRRLLQSSAASSPEGLTPLVAQCSAGGSDSEGCTNALGVIFLLAAHINPEERAASGGSDGTSNLYIGLDALTYFRTATHFLSTYTKWMTIDPTTAGGAPSGDDGSSSTSSSSSSSSSTSNRSTAEASNASKLNALFASIVREVGALACSLKLEALAVSPLRRAIACAQRGQKVLTPAHTQLIRVCLKSRQLSIAKQILDDPIFGIDPEHTGLETKDFLLYFYYGGLAYAALKDFDRAAEFFIQCINMPSESDAVSSIAVEAFKRLCIVQLFLSRGPQHGPSVWKRRSTPRGAASSLEIAAPVYVKLARQLIACFEGKDAVAERRVNQMVLDNHEKFVADNMLGLVKQAISLITRERIRRLTSTYLTLSLGDIALSVGRHQDKGGMKPPSVGKVENIVVEMIENGTIFATIDRKSQMVSFHDDPRAFAGRDALDKMTQRMQAMVKIAERVRSMDATVTTSKAFVKAQVTADRLREDMAAASAGAEAIAAAAASKK